MALFRGFFGGGGNDEERDESGAEVVEKLVDRVETSTALEDRRDALRALRSVAKKMRLHVGTMGLKVFMEILEHEQGNPELLFMTLDILVAVLSSDDESTDEDDLGERLAQEMLRKGPFIPSILSAVDQYDFSVRRAGIQLLSSLLRHRGSEVQNLVMQQAMGITKLVDLLHETREVIRNEAVLMLCELSRSNSQVQQLLAYDNAFTLLFDVVDAEPFDSIVIEDCLFGILNLLRKNSMNQQLFRENNLIPRLGIILHQFLYGNDDEDQGEGMPNDSVPTSAENWAKQRTANVIFLLQILRALVAPDNAAGITHTAQKAMHQAKMLAELCRVLLSEMGVGVDVLTETVVAVAEIIRGNYTNQEYFASTSLETEDGGVRPSLIVLLVSMTSEKQPFKLRCAVFYCLLSYLHDNEFAKTKMIETLLPTSQPEHSSLTPGSLICQALSSGEPIQSWFGCISLLHCLLDIDHLRDQLLRVQLTVQVDETMGLLHHVTQLLISLGNRRPQSRAGLLQLLGCWLHDSPRVVSSFVAHDEILHHLTAQMLDECGEGSESEQQVLRGLIAFILLTCRNNIKDDDKALGTLTALLDRRVGRDRLADALEGVSRTEQFVRAAQKAQPLAKSPTELFLDFHFVKLFKSAESKLLKSLRSGDSLTASTSSNNEAIIQSYKELIKRQDEEISVLKQEAKKSLSEMEKLRKEADRSDLERELAETQSKLQQTSISGEKTASLESQVASLTGSVTQWRTEMEKYKAWAEQWQSYQLTQLPNGGVDTVVQQLQYQQSTLEQQLQYGYTAFEQQALQLAAAAGELEQWKNHSSAWEGRANEIERMWREQKEKTMSNGGGGSNGIHGESTSNSSSEVIRLQNDQEELFELLADQHTKMNQYRKRLRALGQPVSDDEDE
ncbi:hypothetical protein PFISCL1PPCAC_14925 [Pristionchus fissidentatus]|uniref:Uso-1 n=1 Tax=Pristionchus fissidentatus TaxID=1538716 RepID=A0AAV5VW45_9BILA|nr:hypothetical protein PFISCL1PPCAC_14925 [Pristionchus fissidentatus]